MKSTRLFALAALALSLYGCGGGSAPVTGNPGGDSLTRGRAQLEQVASGAKSADAPTLESILALFNEALQTTPGKKEAHFGAAICLAGVVAQETEGPTSTGGVSGGNPGGGANGWSPDEVPPAPPGDPTPPRNTLPRRTLGLLWNLDRGLSDPLTLLNMLAPVSDLRFGFLPYYGYAQDDASRRQAMLTRLNTVAQHLVQVEADPNFTYTLPDADHNGQSVTITLAEVYLFDAYVQTLRAEIAFSLAYIRDAGETPPPPPAFGLGDGTVTNNHSSPGRPEFLRLYQDANQDGKLAPGEYLPPSPFLTLRDAGLLQTAQQAMLAVEEKGKKGSALALARTGDGNFLLPNTTEMRAALTRLRDVVLPLIKQAATGPVTLEMPRPMPMPLTALVNNQGQAQRPGGNTLFAPAIWPELPPEPPVQDRATLKINLAAWFANPPADLKVFAPTYTLTEEGWPRYDTAAYPDLNFGGLFPDGLPPLFRF